MTSELAGRPQRSALVTRLLWGLLIAVVTAVVTVVEAFLVVLRAGTVRAPVSIVMAVVLHPLLTRWMRDTTASRPAALIPFAVWVAIVLPLGAPRAEGDLVLTGEWVSYAYLLIAMASFALSIGLLLPRRRRGR